jgi:hypothetical protein
MAGGARGVASERSDVCGQQTFSISRNRKITIDATRNQQGTRRAQSRPDAAGVNAAKSTAAMHNRTIKLRTPGAFCIYSMLPP